MTTPTRELCGTVAAHQNLLEADPGLAARREEILAAVDTSIASGRARQVAEELETITVVVHVVAADDDQDISDAQIRSQIDILNRDFRASNDDRLQTPGVWQDLVADTRIEFELATQNPDGERTDGIVRVRTDRTSFTVDDAVKSSATGGSDPWPTDRYLNLWVCRLGGGLLGYAQFPGGPPATDGVVILDTACGDTGTATEPFHLGRTAVHEVGHWLDLHHIWGDRTDCTGDDLVGDTPPARRPNTGKPAFPHVTCSNGPSGDMFMNYMDYVDDDAMYMFTLGQSDRMNAILDGARASLARAGAVR